MRSTSCNTRRLHDESGQVLVMAAVMLPVLIGAVGMAIDVGYAYDARQRMQMAADSGAMAGAFAVDADGAITSTNLTATVNIDTTQNGFVNGTNGVTITVCRPGVDLPCPTTYTYAPTDKAVKVTINQPRATFFSGILGRTSMTVGVSAVASASSGGGGLNSNIVVLDDTCKNGAFTASGSSTVAVNGSVYVNSCHSAGLTVSGGGSLVANGGVTMGCTPLSVCGGTNASGGSTISPAATTGPQIPDPLKDLPAPTPAGTVYSNPNIGSGTVTLNPGIYDGGITVSGGTVTFNPGIYFIDGQGGGKKLDFKNTATVLGDGVMFYLYNTAQLNIANSATTVTMSAPTSGTYRGIWLFQERTNTKNPTVSGTATVNIDGTIYVSTPGTKLTFSGGSTSGTLASYTVFVVWNFTLSGGGTWNSDFSSIGGSPLGGGKSVTLAE